MLHEKQQLLLKCTEQKEQLIAAKVEAKIYRDELSALEAAGTVKVLQIKNRFRGHKSVFLFATY